MYSLGPTGEKARNHQLDLQSINSIAKKNILFSGIIGASSAALCVAAELVSSHFFEVDTLHYWLAFGGALALTVTLELLLLYYDSIRATHQIAEVAGVTIFPRTTPVARRLTRAALEIPCPRSETHEINPIKNLPKWQRVSYAIIYKGKIMLSNLIAKIILRRIFFQGTARVWLEFIAVPVTAFWNVFVAKKIMHEVKMRVIVPHLLDHIVPALLEGASEDLLENCERAVGCSASASLTLHPNLVHLLDLIQSLGDQRSRIKLDSQEIFLQQYKNLRYPEKKISLQILTLASIADCKYNSKEAELVNLSAETIDLKVSRHHIKKLKKQFLTGQDLSQSLEFISLAQAS